ncbi:MAG: N,N-dimethylformamidase beta subunit family domain-containing protein, partial [Burkholderiales bacterium]
PTPTPTPTPGPNATQLENAKTGTAEWAIPNSAVALNREIEGYASATSINRGESINLYVNTSDTTYTVSVYRYGWYGGLGGRMISTSQAPIPGIVQSTCDHDTSTHLVECSWQSNYTITANNPSDPTDWPSGYYLAKLTGEPSGKQSYIIFVVRDDNRASDFLFQSSVTTYAAYNGWTDIKDADGKFVNYGSYSTPQAKRVSFNRPYQVVNPSNRRELKGAGFFLEWESSMVRFIEREGYDVSYNTNIDTHAAGNQLLKYKAFLSVGHDEYWSMDMRNNVENARDAGVNLAFLGANAAYWQIRLDPSNAANGAKPNRNIVAYKYDWGNDPAYRTDPQSQLVTRRFRDLPIKLPEASFIGVQYIFNSLENADMVISDCSSSLCDGTKSTADQTKRLQPGDKFIGLLGYEVDGKDTSSPSNIQTIAASPFTCPANVQTSFPQLTCDGITQNFSHMTQYIAASGAKVFATGSMQWNWGVDDSGPYGNALLNENVKQITRNVFNSFISAPPTRVVSKSAMPESMDNSSASVNSSASGGGCTSDSLKPERIDMSMLLLFVAAIVFRYRFCLRRTNSLVSRRAGSKHTRYI